MKSNWPPAQIIPARAAMDFVAGKFARRLTDQGADWMQYPSLIKIEKGLRMSRLAEAGLPDLSIFLAEQNSDAPKVTKHFLVGDFAELYRSCLGFTSRYAS